MILHAVAIGELAKRCSLGKFDINIIILEEYETVCKIQLNHENGFKLLTFTETSNIKMT